MMLILNEEKYAKDLLTGARQDVKSIVKKIELITRYNYHVLQKTDVDNYKSCVLWLEKHHNIFCEQNYSNVISDHIKKAKKRPFYNVPNIQITKTELNIIESQKDIKHEKVLFSLLCMAKLQKFANGYDNGLVAYNIPELFKSSRVVVPVSTREDILNDFFMCGLIGVPRKVDTQCLFVNFIDDGDDVAFELSEKDCEDLAYAYLYYTKKGKIIRCTKCGRLIKKSKKYDYICEDCQRAAGQMRVRWCVDCGLEFQVNNMDNRTCRCEVCQTQRDKISKSERNKKYYELNKIKTVSI